METKVMVCTALGPGKDYCRQFLPIVLAGLTGVALFHIVYDDVTPLPSIPGIDASLITEETLPRFEEADPFRYSRLARMREACRAAFLATDCMHLYFHDCDIIPPADIIPQLLASGARVVSGIYPLRDISSPIMPVFPFVSLVNLQIDRVECMGYGMGCMLISREVMEQTEFSQCNTAGEDWDWCERSGTPVRLLPKVSSWHVSGYGTAARIKIGSSQPGALWTEPTCAFVSTPHGEFQWGVPRFDLTAEQLATLGPGFYVGEIGRIALETEPVAAVIHYYE